jgi:hypothetical protein
VTLLSPARGGAGYETTKTENGEATKTNGHRILQRAIITRAPSGRRAGIVILDGMKLLDGIAILDGRATLDGISK